MAITDPVPVPPEINPGLRAARQTTMLSLLGNPRASYSDDCQEITHPRLKTLVVTRDVGPFRARGLQPAVDSLAAVMADIEREHADIHAALGTAGMLCCRFVRGSTRAISNHSWGTAIDLKLAGKLDRPGDGQVQRGLAPIAPIFNRHGWYWGADFGKEDGMHFEASDGLIREWNAKGLLGAPVPEPAAAAPAPGISLAPPPMLAEGDRGRDVRRLQAALNAAAMRAGIAAGVGLVELVEDPLAVDGDFGPATRAAVAAFQAGRGLAPTGVADGATLAALDLADAAGVG